MQHGNFGPNAGQWIGSLVEFLKRHWFVGLVNFYQFIIDTKFFQGNPNLLAVGSVVAIIESNGGGGLLLLLFYDG
jgi:hypothetical protein